MLDALALYRVLWKWGYGEIRAYSGGARSVWAVAGDEESLSKALSMASYWSDRGWHVAGSVNPRSRRRHPCAKGVDVSHYVACVLDFDSQDTAASGTEKLSRSGIEPSIIVHSGRGRHIYLLLDEPIAVDVFRSTSKRIGDACGSDAVHDPVRILRTPGTLNPRTGTKASVLMFKPEITYAVEELKEAFPLEAVPPPRPACAFTGPRFKIPNGTYYPSRSEQVLATARRLLVSGKTREEAARILTSLNLRPKSDKDIERCIEKVWSTISPLEFAHVHVSSLVSKESGLFVRVEVITGRWVGRSWWQKIDKVEDEVGLCLGGPVNAQGGGGRASLGMISSASGLVLRVRSWIPKETI